jgi:hypothetical protein
MTAHHSRSPDIERNGIARLVEAERGWQHSLDAARAAGDQLSASAAARAAAAEQAFEASLPEILAARRQELAAAREAAVRAVAAALDERTRRYTVVPDAFVERLAEHIAARAPWLTEQPGDRGGT